MDSELLPSLQISVLLYQKGQFREALSASLKSIEETRAASNTAQWLEAIRIQSVCLVELARPAETLAAVTELKAFIQESTELKSVSTAHYILSFIALNNGDFLQAQDELNVAIAGATQQQNHRTLGYALYADAFLKVIQPEKEFQKASLNLEKIEIICRQHAIYDLRLSSQLLRCYILTENGQLDEALQLLWKSYDLAKIKGLGVMISSIQAQMARIYLLMSKAELASEYAELALRGISEIEQPRLYKQIASVCPDAKSLKRSDIEVDEIRKSIIERNKGLITFGRQHILLDIAMLFLKNPGVRYQKSDLTQKIWQEPYDPVAHDNLIYVSIKRLRTLLEPRKEPYYLLKDREGYYFNPETTVRFKLKEDTQ